MCTYSTITYSVDKLLLFRKGCARAQFLLDKPDPDVFHERAVGGETATCWISKIDLSFLRQYKYQRHNPEAVLWTAQRTILIGS